MLSIPDEVERYRMVERAQALADVLHQLAQDPGDWVRWEVAFHPSTTRETVTGLVNDFCGCTREAAQARLDSWDNYSTEALARFYCAEEHEDEEAESSDTRTPDVNQTQDRPINRESKGSVGKIIDMRTLHTVKRGR